MNPVILLTGELAKHVQSPEGGPARASIQNALPGYDIQILDGDAQGRAFDRVEVIAGNVDPAILSRLPALKWYHQWFAGADWILRNPELATRDFVLTNASGVHSVQITEHIFGFLTAFARNLQLNVRAQAARTWRKDSMTGVFELYEKTVLVAGLGAIGSRFARVARAFDMKVVGMRRHPERGGDDGVRMIGPDELDGALPECDFVVIALPGTRDTYHMFGEDAFRRMKRSAYLVNIGRGSVVDEPALVAAIEHGEIAGAGLDVFETEPLPPDSPLWHMERVIISPHTSGMTPRYFERAFGQFIENVQRYRSGRTLMNIVDKRAGY